MAGASIHIGKGNAGFLSHNDRSRSTKNSIFSDEKNEVLNDAKKAFEIYREELKKRSEAYTLRTGQKLQKNTTTHLSAIVNLERFHTLFSLSRLILHLEDTLDTKVFQVAIHRDEGYIDENGKQHKNYHAHIEFMGIDSEGRSIRRKLTKKYLSDLQTKNAKLLMMERGKKNSRKKRLDTYEYKRAAEIKEKSVKEAVKQVEFRLKTEHKYKVGDLKREIEQMRKQMIESEKRFSQEDYKELSKLKKRLNKNTVKEIAETFEKLRKDVFSDKYVNEKMKKVKHKTAVKHLENKLIEAQEKNEKLENKLIEAQEKNKTLENKLIEAQETIKKQNSTIESQEDTIDVLRRDLRRLEQTLEDIERKYKTIIDDAEKVIKDLREKEQQQQEQQEQSINLAAPKYGRW